MHVNQDSRRQQAGSSLQEEMVECSHLAAGHARIRFPVTDCNEYLHRNHPSLYEMESIAWVLRTDASRQRIGFVRARDLTPSDRFVLPDDDDWSVARCPISHHVWTRLDILQTDTAAVAATTA